MAGRKTTEKLNEKRRKRRMSIAAAIFLVKMI
jgi:hypothetical protein